MTRGIWTTIGGAVVLGAGIWIGSSYSRPAPDTTHDQVVAGSTGIGTGQPSTISTPTALPTDSTVATVPDSVAVGETITASAAYPKWLSGAAKFFYASGRAFPPNGGGHNMDCGVQWVPSWDGHQYEQGQHSTPCRPMCTNDGKNHALIISNKFVRQADGSYKQVNGKTVWLQLGTPNCNL